MNAHRCGWLLSLYRNNRCGKTRRVSCYSCPGGGGVALSSAAAQGTQHTQRDAARQTGCDVAVHAGWDGCLRAQSPGSEWTHNLEADPASLPQSGDACRGAVAALDVCVAADLNAVAASTGVHFCVDRVGIGDLQSGRGKTHVINRHQAVAVGAGKGRRRCRLRRCIAAWAPTVNTVPNVESPLACCAAGRWWRRRRPVR